LVFEKDTDAYARERDEQVMHMAGEAGVKVIVKVGRTLYDPDEIVKNNGGKPTMSITQLQHAAEKIGDIEKPVETPTSLPDPGTIHEQHATSEPALVLFFAPPSPALLVLEPGSQHNLAIPLPQG
jgi:deoxyribodipyrimidine photolyase